MSWQSLLGWLADIKCSKTDLSRPSNLKKLIEKHSCSKCDRLKCICKKINAPLVNDRDEKWQGMTDDQKREYLDQELDDYQGKK